MMFLVAAVALAFLNTKPVKASGTIIAVPATNATVLAAKLISPDGGAIVTNAVLNGHPECAGLFYSDVAVLPAEGVILSSGSVVDIQGPNDDPDTTSDLGGSGDPDLDALIPGYSTRDACVLEFDFECPAGMSGDPSIAFSYVFGSEEYNEWVDSSFNDVFGFFLNGPNNIALLENGNPVSINNVNNDDSSHLYIDNEGGSLNLEADGLTVPMISNALFNVGQVNHIKLAIADAGDHILDSWVLLKAESFTCFGLNEPPTARCKDVTVPAGEGCQDTTVTAVNVNDGSSDPEDGYAVEVSLEPAGPYPIGETEVTLTVTDSEGASDTCTATVTVVDEEYPVVDCGSIGVIAPCEVPVSINFGTKTKNNGCSVESVVVAHDGCYACNGAGKTVGRDCTVSVENSSAFIGEAGGVASHIVFEIEASNTHGGLTSTGTCTICTQNPSVDFNPGTPGCSYDQNKKKSGGFECAFGFPGASFECPSGGRFLRG